MKRITYVVFCLLVLAACASPQVALRPPAPQEVPAWILEPGPNLIQLLDNLISPYATESTEQLHSSPPVKSN